MKQQRVLIFAVGIFVFAPFTTVAQTTTTVTKPAPTVSGFAPNPVSGFAPNPVTGFSPAPVRGLAPQPVGPFAPKPVNGFTHTVPFSTPPLRLSNTAPIIAPAVPRVIAAPNIQTIPPTATNTAPLF